MSRSEESYQEKRRKLSYTESCSIVVIALAVFSSQLLIGGGSNLTSLIITLGYGVAIGILATLRWVRRAFSCSFHLKMLTILFLLLILYILYSILASMGGELLSRPSFSDIHSASVDPSKTLLELIKLFGIACAFLVGVSTGRSVTRARFAFQTFGLFGALFGFASIIVFVFAPTTTMGFGRKVFFTSRLTASFLSANTAGTFFGVCVLLALFGLLLAVRSFKERIHRGRWIESFAERCAAPTAAILVSGTALLLTASRTAIIATGLTALLLVVAEGGTRRWSTKTFVATIVPAIIFGAVNATLIGGGAVLQRMNFLSGDSLVRIHIYQAHASAMRQSQWSGLGLGTFETINRSLLTPDAKVYNDLWLVRAMHNVYMQWIEGAGWLGTLLMFSCVGFILFGMVWSVVKRFVALTEILTVLSISLLILIHGLTDFALEDFSIAAWWSVLLGIGYALAISRYQV